jgi:hypothetical protein
VIANSPYAPIAGADSAAPNWTLVIESRVNSTGRTGAGLVDVTCGVDVAGAGEQASVYSNMVNPGEAIL